MKTSFDVAIIGGGPAGLSAALTLARGGRSVYVIDAGKGRNAPAAHMMNFPSRDGTPPLEFKRLIKEDLKKYASVKFESAVVTSLTKINEGFEINGNIQAKKILLAHGIHDILPSIPGLKELWGKSIFHCPYCHGHEHKNEPIGFIMGEKYAAHMGALLLGLTQDLILFTNGEKINDVSPFERNGIKVYIEKIESFIHEGESLKGVKLATGEVIPRNYLFFKAEQKLTSDLGIKLGCELNEFGLYKTDETGMTTQPGIYAAGDIASPKQSVLNACASGSMAGAFINYEILHQKFDKRALNE